MDAVEVIAGTAELERVWQRLRPRFARAEMRVRAAATCPACWAESNAQERLATGRARWGSAARTGCSACCAPARWDADAVRDDLRAYVVEHLGDPAACWSLMRRAFSRRAPSRSGCSASTAARRGGSRTARSASSWPMPARRGMPSWTGRCTCRRLGGRCGPPGDGGHPLGGALRHQGGVGADDAGARLCRGGAGGVGDGR